MGLPQTSISKISPLILGDVVPRERLFALLDAKPPTNAFWISGPGGSGKTTFIASYLKERQIPCLWYQVDAMDVDPATFFYYLGQAAAPLMDSPTPPMPLLTPEYLATFETFVRQYFELLYQRIRRGSWLIFDNFQDAPEESLLLHILITAVKQLPGDFHLAIVSRTTPPLDVSRLLANRRMKFIGQNQINFSPKEFDKFLVFTGYPITQQETQRLYQLTKGWIAGAILWLLHADNQTTGDKFPTQYTPHTIFAYFAAEIFEKISSTTKSFLLQTALLPHMTASMAHELTGMDAEGIIEGLSHKNFFIEKRRLHTASYQYHPLFHQFLQTTAARTYTSSVLRQMYLHAADILEKHGYQEQAIDLYIKAEAYETMATLIVKLAPALIAQGRFTVLHSWIELLPQQYTEKNPWLLFWLGLARMTGNPPASQVLLNKAFNLFTINHDIVGQVYSWSTSVEIFFLLRSVFTDLDNWIKKGEQLDRVLAKGPVPAALTGRFASSMLMALLLRDQGHPDLPKYQDKCEALLGNCHDDVQLTVNLLKNLFWSYHWCGQIHKARIAETRLAALQNLGNLPPIAQLTLQCIFTLASVVVGDHQKCLDQAAETLALADATGIHVYDFMMYAYLSYSLLGTGELERIPEILAKMKEILMPFAVWDQGHYYFFQTWYRIQTGNIIEAKSSMTTAVRLVESCGNPFTIALCRILHSQLLLESADEHKAEQQLLQVINEKKLQNSSHVHFLAELALADCQAAQQKKNKARLHIQKAFAIAGEHGLTMPVGLSHRRLAALCAFALDEQIEQNLVIEMIRRWRLTPFEPHTFSERWPWPVRIHTLGSFTITCDNTILVSSSKLPPKPLQLLTMLIAAGQKGMFRERIAARLWPDSDGDRALQSLNTTLHRLRKILGRDDAVVLINSQLLLNDRVCWVDSRHFTWLAQQVKAAPTLSTNSAYIKKALALYQGPFTTGQESIPVALQYSEQLEKQWRQLLLPPLSPTR